MGVEQNLISRLKQGDEKAFTLLFRKYYTDLVFFAVSYIPEKEVCEDIVQNVFVNIWGKRAQLKITTSLKSFLLRSVANGCLDEIRRRKTVLNYETALDFNESIDNLDTENYILHSELSVLVDKAIRKLPKRYRETFEMSRSQGMKYKEIASKLNISERTVQDRIAKTLDMLRTVLKDFLSFLLFLHLF